MSFLFLAQKWLLAFDFYRVLPCKMLTPLVIVRETGNEKWIVFASKMQVLEMQMNVHLPCKMPLNGP